MQKVHPAIKAKATITLKQIPHTMNELCGYDRQERYFDISRNTDSSCGGFYIIVREANGMASYDGYWGGAENTLREAVEEAITGSLIVQPKKKVVES